MRAMILLAAFAMAMLQTVVPPARSIDKGSRSEMTAARQVAVSDHEAWAALWREHAPTRPLPDVDFSRETVAGVFLGTRPSSGFAVEIVGSRQDGGQTVVEYREKVPSRGDITAQVLVSPYHLVAFPKQAGTVTFEKLKN
jgi:hypothetical protein